MLISFLLSFSFIHFRKFYSGKNYDFVSYLKIISEMVLLCLESLEFPRFLLISLSCSIMVLHLLCLYILSMLWWWPLFDSSKDPGYLKTSGGLGGHSDGQVCNFYWCTLTACLHFLRYLRSLLRRFQLRFFYNFLASHPSNFKQLISH